MKSAAKDVGLRLMNRCPRCIDENHYCNLCYTKPNEYLLNKQILLYKYHEEQRYKLYYAEKNYKMKAKADEI